MGMFDWVKYNGETYQTKCLDRCLETYMLSGTTLLFKDCEGYWDEEEGLFGGFVEVTHKWVKYPFTGTLYFYNMDEEYSAKFISGELVELVNTNF